VERIQPAAPFVGTSTRSPVQILGVIRVADDLNAFGISILILLFLINDKE